MKTQFKAKQKQPRQMTSKESDLSVIPNGQTLNLVGRITYLVDVIGDNNKAIELDDKPSRYGGFFYSKGDPIWGRFLALSKAQEWINTPRYQQDRDFEVRVVLYEDKKRKKHIIYDSACANSFEICKNLDYEFNLLTSLGCKVNDWDIINDADGKTYRAIKKECRFSESLSGNQESDLEPEDKFPGFPMS